MVNFFSINSYNATISAIRLIGLLGRLIIERFKEDNDICTEIRKILDNILSDGQKFSFGAQVSAALGLIETFNGKTEHIRILLQWFNAIPTTIRQNLPKILLTNCTLCAKAFM